LSQYVANELYFYGKEATHKWGPNSEISHIWM